eukprot:549337_1
MAKRILFLSIAFFMIYTQTVSPQTTTRPPSSDPTMEPTLSSSQPSSAPTTPSQPPTDYPSSNPSQPPSIHPSSNPSKQPTTQPSAGSAHPSISPFGTQFPSTSPTLNPSQHPSQNPSKSPSQHPSLTPSNVPSKAPTNNPTSAPLFVTQHPSNIASTSTARRTTDDGDKNDGKDSQNKEAGTKLFIIGLIIFLLLVVVIMLVGYFRLKREDDIKLHPHKYDRSSSKFLGKKNRSPSNWLKSISINSSRSSPPPNRKKEQEILPKNEALKPPHDVVPMKAMHSDEIDADALFAARLQLEEVEAQYAEVEEQFAREVEVAKKIDVGHEEVELQLADDGRERVRDGQEFAGEGKANLGEEGGAVLNSGDVQ